MFVGMNMLKYAKSLSENDTDVFAFCSFRKLWFYFIDFIFYYVSTYVEQYVEIHTSDI